MTNNKPKHLALIGVLGVGKSLITPALSEKLGYDYVCIDDLVEIINAELSEFIGPEPRDKQRFVKETIEDILKSKETAYLLKDPKYKDTEMMLINNFVKLYEKYKTMFGSFKPFYETISKNNIMLENYTSPSDFISGLSLITAELLELIIKKSDKPLIIDLPGSVGWHTQDIALSRRVQKALNKEYFYINTDKCKNTLDTFLRDSTTILLEPSIDYSDRNPASQVRANNRLLSNQSAYHDSGATICISTYGLFLDSKDPSLQRRSWFDAEEYLAKKNLVNTREIDNLILQIMMCKEELDTDKGM